jgi:hypothetical protein
MAKQWDSLIKLLVGKNQQDLVSLLLPGAKFVRELNIELHSRVLEADLLDVVNLDGADFGLMRSLCGDWIKLCVGRASEAEQSEPAHTSAFSGI